MKQGKTSPRRGVSIPLVETGFESSRRLFVPREGHQPGAGEDTPRRPVKAINQAASWGTEGARYSCRRGFRHARRMRTRAPDWSPFFPRRDSGTISPVASWVGFTFQDRQRFIKEIFNLIRKKKLPSRDLREERRREISSFFKKIVFILLNWRKPGRLDGPSAQAQFI